MMRAAFSRLRSSVTYMRLAAWASHLRYRLSDWSSGQLLFLLMLSVPFCVIAAIARFAWLDHQRMAAERQRIADLTCLAQNIYHEARGESMAGQRAVAEVTMNRVRSSLYPDTVCEVVHEKRWDRVRQRYVGAFSWTELDIRAMPPPGVAWQRSVAAAQAVYDGNYEPQVGNALHYHATRIEPRWARGREPLVTIGRHAFYEPP